MSLPHVTAAEAQALVAKGAILVDIREAGEYAAENVPGAAHHPLSRLGEKPVAAVAPVLIFMCRSGGRTRMNAAALARCTDAEAYILDGGIEAWKRAGLPVRRG
jgi:rhodanese-related sulfurtransferase